MLFRFAQIFFRMYFFLYHRLSVRGLSCLKKFLADNGGKPVILAANHESYLDPPLVGMLFPNAIRFIAWDGIFKFRPFAALLRALGAVPVSQENKNSAASLLRDVMEFIRQGFSVLIFPEGERSHDGNVGPFEGGVALISTKTLAPIVPVWIDGTFEAYPRFRKFPRPKRVAVTFGNPIFPGDIPRGIPEKERRRLLLDTLERALAGMRDGVSRGHNCTAAGIDGDNRALRRHHNPNSPAMSASSRVLPDFLPAFFNMAPIFSSTDFLSSSEKSMPRRVKNSVGS